jgi:hypothetical protein
VSNTQRKRHQDLTKTEGEATEPVLSHATVPNQPLTEDLTLLEGEATDPSPVFYRDPTDKLEVWGGIRLSGANLGHVIEFVGMFAGTSGVSMYLLNESGPHSTVIGLIAAVSGKLTFAVAKLRSKRTK